MKEFLLPGDRIDVEEELIRVDLLMGLRAVHGEGRNEYAAARPQVKARIPYEKVAVAVCLEDQLNAAADEIPERFLILLRPMGEEFNIKAEAG